MDAAEEQAWRKRRRLTFGIIIAVALLAVGILTRAGSDSPGQKLSASGASSTTRKAVTSTAPDSSQASSGGSSSSVQAASGTPNESLPTGPTTSAAGTGSSSGPAQGSGGNANGSAANPSGNAGPTPTIGRNDRSGAGTGGGVDGGGAAGGSAATSPPTTTTTVGASGSELKITEADVGKTLTMTKGSKLVVELTAASLVMGKWTLPSSDGASLTRGATSQVGDKSTATFSADSPGTAQVTATAPPSCRQESPPCQGVPDFQFQVTVNVVA